MNKFKFYLKFKKGFTLVELIITIAIVAILASIAVPTSIAMIKRAQEESSKQIVSAVLIDAHSYLTSVDKLGNTTSNINEVNIIENTVYGLKTNLMKKHPNVKFIVVSDRGDFKPIKLPNNLINDFNKLGVGNNQLEYKESFVLVYLRTSYNQIQVAQYKEFKLDDTRDAVQIKKYYYKNK